MDEIYEDELEEEQPVRQTRRSSRNNSNNMQAAASEAHELLKKEIAAATAEESDEAADRYSDELPSYQELQRERRYSPVEEEEWEEEEPVEIKKMAMPAWSASQLADKARKAGDAPDIVRDSITKVTLFDYSDIIGGEEEDIEEE